MDGTVLINIIYQEIVVFIDIVYGLIIIVVDIHMHFNLLKLIM